MLVGRMGCGSFSAVVTIWFSVVSLFISSRMVFFFVWMLVY